MDRASSRASFLGMLRKGALSICQAMRSFTLMPPPRSLDDIQEDLTQRYGIDFSFDDCAALSSDWKAVGDDLKQALKSIQQKKVDL